MAEERFFNPPKKIDTALVGIVLTLLLQTGAGVWWAATTSSRLAKLEEERTPIRQMITSVAVLEERTKGIERIERKLNEIEDAR